MTVVANGNMEQLAQTIGVARTVCTTGGAAIGCAQILTTGRDSATNFHSMVL